MEFVLGSRWVWGLMMNWFCRDEGGFREWNVGVIEMAMLARTGKKQAFVNFQN